MKNILLLNTPVLFLVFNRPDTTSKVFEAIRKAKPERLYIASDGSRSEIKGENIQVENVREIATNVDWPCEVKTLFQDQNLGCKYGPIAGIDWFFENEEEGIILEDDCLPHPDFFKFCSSLLNYHRNNNRIFMISGNNFQNGKRRGKASYYYSKYPHTWGWATWRRSWIHNDPKINFWLEWKNSSEWDNTFQKKEEADYWINIFNDVIINNWESAWDYPWIASMWHSGGISIIPNVNLVSNIGFGMHATHTKNPESNLAQVSTVPIGKNIIHPNNITINNNADRYTFRTVYKNTTYYKIKYMVYKLINNTYKYLCNRLQWINNDEDNTY